MTETSIQSEVELPEDKEKYENPEIADDPTKRLEHAISYVRLRGWSLRKAGKKSGACRSTLTK